MKSNHTAVAIGAMLLAGVSASAGLVSWWTGQDNANDVVGSNHGTLGNGAGFVPGRYGQGFSFNGVAGYVSVPHDPSLRPGTNSFSLAAWIKTTNGTGWHIIISQYEGSGSSFGLGLYQGAVVDGKLRFDLRDSDRGGDPAPDVGGGQKLVGTHDVADGAFHHVVFMRDVERGEMRIHLDGALEASAPLNAGATGTIQDDDGEDDLVIVGAGRDTYLTTVTGIFDGIIDEVQFYAGALTAQQVAIAAAGAQSIYSYDAGLGTLPEAQGFTRFQTPGFIEPTLSGGVLHQHANYAVGYQFWYDNTGHFDFSTDSYVLEAALRVISASDVEPGNFGWQMEVIDSAGHQVVATIGTNAVTVSGGASSSSTIPFNATDGFHMYRVVIANGAAALFIDGNQVASTPVGTPTHPEAPYPNRVYFGDGGGYGVSEVELRQFSFARTLDVSPCSNCPPVIITQPVSRTKFVGSSVPFNVAASGTAPLSFQWQFNGTNISGATNTTLTLSDIQLTDAGDYAVIIANSLRSATSAPARLAVVPLIITSQPQGLILFAGGNVTFTVGAVGHLPVSYQWLREGVAIIGATNASYQIVNAQTNDTGYYSVMVSNLYGSATSSNAALTVLTRVDYFTESFNPDDNDLAFSTLTFTPDGSANFYALCRDAATSFPTDPANGIFVPLGDDNYVPITLTGTNTVGIYKRRSNVFFIGSNGYLTMDYGDSGYDESLSHHFDQPRVSALLSDLNLEDEGTVSWRELSNRVAITYQKVPHYHSGGANSFQIEMFFDGRIRLTYLGLSAQGGLAGLSAGQGVPMGFLESDLNSYGPCVIRPPGPAIAVEQPLNTYLADGGSKDFGNVTVGSSDSLTFTIRNLGTADLIGFGITVDGPDAAMFNVAANPLAPVSPGGSTTFTARFTPASAGAKMGTMHIASNDPAENPFDITLTGNGLALSNTVTPPSFEETFAFSLGNYWCENHLNVADMDGDGRKDIVLMTTALSNTNGPPWGYLSRAILLHAEQDGTFTDSVITNFPGRYGYGAYAADLNNDGTPDLILREQSATHVLLNDGHGAFREVWTGGPGYYHLATVDVNHDGFLDIVSGTQTGGGGLIDVFTNNGAGTSFTKAWQSRLYGGGYDSIETVLSVNLNNDGVPDIAAREIYGGRMITLTGAVSGDGFIERAETYLGDRTFALAAGRVNGDAVADLAAFVGWGSVRVFVNRGDGSMSNYWESPNLGQAALNLALADFDQDGFDDIFVGTFADGALRIYRNNPGVGFDPWWQGSVPGAGYTGTVADLNGDGYPDMIVGEKNRLRVMLNRIGNPRIAQLRMTDTGATVTWAALPGKTYRMQFKSRLQDPEWTDLEGDVVSDSATASKTDPTAGSEPHRLYRIVKLP